MIMAQRIDFPNVLMPKTLTGVQEELIIVYTTCNKNIIICTKGPEIKIIIIIISYNRS